MEIYQNVKFYLAQQDRLFVFCRSGNKRIVCEKCRQVEEDIRSQRTSHYVVSGPLG